MDKNIIIAIVLGALVLVAAIQAVQLFGLKNKVQTGQVAATVQSGPVGGSPSLPSNIQNLPNMVGGC